MYFVEAEKIIKSLPKEQKILFAPDKTWGIISAVLQGDYAYMVMELAMCTKDFRLERSWS